MEKSFYSTGQTSLKHTHFTTTMSLIREIQTSVAAKGRKEERFRAMVCGQSMLPSLSPGTWIWIQPVGITHDKKQKRFNLRLGDIIVFSMKAYEGFVCHRVIAYNRQWIWQASEHYGTYSRIPRNSVVGKVYVWGKSDAEKQILSMSARFMGLFRCYRNLIIRRLQRCFCRLCAG